MRVFCDLSGTNGTGIINEFVVPACGQRALDEACPREQVCLWSPICIIPTHC